MANSRSVDVYKVLVIPDLIGDPVYNTLDSRVRGNDAKIFMDVSLPAIDVFVNDLMTQKFAGKTLDEAVAADIKRELTERLNQYLTLRTIELISTANPEAISQLSTLIKTNPKPEEVGQFISKHVSDPDVLVSQIFTDFRDLYLGRETKQSN